mmetsp:Transcript_36898/g.88135  ORF Transcript_36898/g.88135 Transcript_36898/m.88135 type:complete len:247 (-) Transcript_36898:793-1533(-)
MQTQQQTTTTASRDMKIVSSTSGAITLTSTQTATVKDSRVSVTTWRRMEHKTMKRFSIPAFFTHHQKVDHVISSLTSSSRRRLPSSFAFFTKAMASLSRALLGTSRTSILGECSCCSNSASAAIRLKASVSITSAGGPVSTMQPSSKSSRRSKCCSRCFSGCVTTIRVRSRSTGPVTSWVKICSPVGPSTEAKGSSISTRDAASIYAARASATRARWPPERRMPKEPMVTWSPPGRICKSEARPAA